MELSKEIQDIRKKLVSVGTCKCGQEMLLPKSIVDRLQGGHGLTECADCNIKRRREADRRILDQTRDTISQERQDHIKNIPDSGNRLQPDEIEDFVTVLYKERTGYPCNASVMAQFAAILKTVSAEKVRANFKDWIFKSQEQPTLRRFLETMGVDYYNNREVKYE